MTAPFLLRWCRRASDFLLYSPSDFCSTFLHLLSSSPAAPPGDPAVTVPRPTAPCSACGVSIAHLSCVPVDRDHPTAAPPCPPCAAAVEGRAFSFVPVPGRRSLQECDVRVLLVAARLAHDSVSRTTAAAREEVERRIATARKRSREMLDADFRALEVEARDLLVEVRAARQPSMCLMKCQ